MIKKTEVGQGMKIVGIISVILIVIAGIYLLLSPTFNNWPKNIRTIFAIIIIVYGFFRLVIIFQKFKKRRYRL